MGERFAATYATTAIGFSIAMQTPVTSAGGTVTMWQTADGDDISPDGGVREPRPRPPLAPAGTVALEIPGDADTR